MTQDNDRKKAEEHRIIAKELGWLAQHYRRLYELEMAELGEQPKPIEDPNQLNLFDL